MAVVILLIFPFFVFASNIVALSIMGLVTLAIIALVTWFGSVVFDRSFLREFTQMASITLGVSAVTFCLGLLFRSVFGISI